MRKLSFLSITFVVAMIFSFANVSSVSAQDFKILLNPTECLDLENSSGTNSVRLTVAKCDDSSTTQRFQIVKKAGTTFVNIKISSNNKRCLDIAPTQKSDGVNVTQYTCDKSAGQAFELRNGAVPTSTGSPLTGTNLTNAQGDAETYCLRRFDYTRGLEVILTRENADCWVKKVKSGEKNLKEAVLSWAMLDKADLSKADLFKAQFQRAKLEGANLSNSDLGEAFLSSADLTKADLTKANLFKANLTGADLREAKSRGLTLTKAIVSRKSTKGFDFDKWKRGGGIVVD